MDRPISRQLFKRAQRAIPGGVNSPVRAFKAVELPPLFAERGEGQYLFDADGNRYLDFLMSWGAIILGHAHEEITDAIVQASIRGTGYGLSTAIEAELAETIKDAFPSIESLRLVNSGTEAVMSAVRLARGFTGRNKVLKFEGGYHGHSDGLLAKAGSGLATFGIPASAGVPATFTAETLVARFNDPASVTALCQAHSDDLACILVEPVAGNMGVVPPEPGFLEGLRAACDHTGALLIFDEVITGFRLAWGGAQERYGIAADLTTLGKIIGGGLPVGAFGGRKKIMDKLAPQGDVYQAGTLSGNPVVVAAGLAVLKTLRRLKPYKELEQKAEFLAEGIKQAARDTGVPLHIGRVGCMFTIFFCDNPVTDYPSARRADSKRYAAFFADVLNHGVLFPPSQWEACFLSTAHTINDLEKTCELIRTSLDYPHLA